MRFPYELYIEVSVGGGYDDDGFKIPATKEWIYVSTCRDTPNGSGSLISTESGEFSNFNSLIYLPIGTQELKVNTRVQVRELSGKVRLTATAIRFNSTQKNCRLWV